MLCGIVCGPTGIGKSQIALEWAIENKAHIISVDSRQIYKDMTIGTAQIKEEDRKGVSHYLMGVLSPTKKISVIQYIQEIEKILAQNSEKKFLLVGGSGFYIQYFLSEYFQENIPEEIKNQVKYILSKEGKNKLYERLYKIDPKKAKQLHQNDTYRVSKAYEYYLTFGRSYLEKKTIIQKKKYSKIPFCILKQDREKLYQTINQRVYDMLDMGWEKEVKELIQKYGKAYNHWQKIIGYQNLIDYIEGKKTINEAIKLIQKDTRHLAKKQITFFKNQFSQQKFIKSNYREFKDFLKTL